MNIKHLEMLVKENIWSIHPSNVTRSTTSHRRKCIPLPSAPLFPITAVLGQQGHIMLANLNFARKVFVFYFKLWFLSMGWYTILLYAQGPLRVWSVRSITSSGLIFVRGFDIRGAAVKQLLVFRKREAKKSSFKKKKNWIGELPAFHSTASGKVCYLKCFYHK